MNQLHLRDAQTTELVRDVARRTGMTMTEVVRTAVRAYAAGLGAECHDVGRLLAWQDALVRDRAKLVGEPPGVDELYGPDGLPR